LIALEFFDASQLVRFVESRLPMMIHRYCHDQGAANANEQAERSEPHGDHSRQDTNNEQLKIKFQTVGHALAFIANGMRLQTDRDRVRNCRSNRDAEIGLKRRSVTKR
jgi:hypothetical protein